MSTTERSAPRSASVTDDIAARGSAAVRETRENLDAAVEDISRKGREALRGAREVRDTFADAILNSVRARPYTMLALAGLIGFAYGAMRRR